jgi:DNA-binding XRE family transcriptional regulator
MAPRESNTKGKSKASATKLKSVPRSVPISIVTSGTAVAEHKFKLPAKVYKEILPLIERYQVTPQEQMNEMVKNPGSRLEGRPKEAIRFCLLRLQNKLTQSQMAFRLEVDQTQVSMMELGKRLISRGIAEKIADEFGVDAQDYWSKE